MKKILYIFMVLMIVTGCSIGSKMTNTPTKKVEAYLDSYQKLDDNVLNDLDELIEDTDYTIEQRARYKEIFKKHYSNLKYEILDEKIDGDHAVVQTQVEVNDYSSILSEKINEDDYKDAEGNYDPKKYFDYQLDKLERATEKIKYTIDFKLTKKDDNWIIDDLDEISLKKIHGIYIR